MKLLIKKSGGFAGVDLEGEFDTADLSNEENEILEKMIRKKSGDPAAGTQADAFQYEMILGDHSVSFPSSTILPEELSLIKRLESKLRPSA